MLDTASVVFSFLDKLLKVTIGNILGGESHMVSYLNKLFHVFHNCLYTSL